MPQRLIVLSPLATLLATAVQTSVALADPLGATTPPPPPPAPPTLPSPPVAAPLAATPVAEPVASPTLSDHDQLVHHLAVGYFGVSLLPIAVPPPGVGLPPTGGTVTAPAIGVRYWFTQRLGVDAAVGFGYSGGSDSVDGTSGATPSMFGFDVHAGLPIAVASSSHFVFELVPEGLLGGTTGSIPGPTVALGQSLRGLIVQVGARVGTELHFGFIGVPQLSLQASVGAYFTHESYSWSSGASSAGVVSNSISTSVQGAPWAIFVNNISALYYL